MGQKIAFTVGKDKLPGGSGGTPGGTPRSPGVPPRLPHRFHLSRVRLGNYQTARNHHTEKSGRFRNGLLGYRVVSGFPDRSRKLLETPPTQAENKPRLKGPVRPRNSRGLQGNRIGRHTRRFHSRTPLPRRSWINSFSMQERSVEVCLYYPVKRVIFYLTNM
jgi:hypothetical protein